MKMNKLLSYTSNNVLEITHSIYSKLPKMILELKENIDLPVNHFLNIIEAFTPEIQKNEPPIILKMLNDPLVQNTRVNKAGGLHHHQIWPIANEDGYLEIAKNWVREAGFSNEFEIEIMPTSSIALSNGALTYALGRFQQDTSDPMQYGKLAIANIGIGLHHCAKEGPAYQMENKTTINSLDFQKKENIDKLKALFKKGKKKKNSGVVLKIQGVDTFSHDGITDNEMRELHQLATKLSQKYHLPFISVIDVAPWPIVPFKKMESVLEKEHKLMPRKRLSMDSFNKYTDFVVLTAGKSDLPASLCIYRNFEYHPPIKKTIAPKKKGDIPTCKQVVSSETQGTFNPCLNSGITSTFSPINLYVMFSLQSKTWNDIVKNHYEQPREQFLEYIQENYSHLCTPIIASSGVVVHVTFNQHPNNRNDFDKTILDHFLRIQTEDSESICVRFWLNGTITGDGLCKKFDLLLPFFTQKNNKKPT